MKFNDMPYKRAVFEEFEEKMKKIIADFEAAGSGEEQFEVHKRYYELENDFITKRVLAHIRHDINMKEEFYNAENDYYDEIMPKIQQIKVEYMKKLYHSPYADYLKEKIGAVAFKNMELAERSFKPELVPLKQEENSLTSRYSKFLAGAKIEFKGETYNFSGMRKFQNDKDREVRKEAFAKTNAFCLEHQDEFDEIYDLLVKNRTKQAQLLGHKNFVPMGYDLMMRNNYDEKMVARFRKQVKEVWVPFVAKLHEKRRKRLGLDHMYYYDEGVFFPDSNPAPKGTPEEILALGRKMYDELSPETSEFYRFMHDNEMFDVIPRMDKRSGGYMTYLPEYKSPFVFANFNTTAGDIDVITHECGHAFQGYMDGRLTSVNEQLDLTMETAEIHSMSMEFFTEPWMEMFFKEDTKKYLEMHLEDAATFIPYGCMVDEFQHVVYNNPELTPKERRAAWLELEKEYRPYMDYADDEFYRGGGLWQRQHHIYTMPFYYIDYALAQSVAFQFKALMDEDYKSAWQTYLKLCRIGVKEFYTDMLHDCGLKTPFEDGYLKDIVDKISGKLGL